MDGFCAHPQFRGTSAKPSLWESRRENTREPHNEAADRHRRARLMCRACPVLEQCESLLSSFERHGDPVDGVMAARYADTGGYAGSKVNVLKGCEGCGEQMIPQRRKPRPNQRRHVGEGLCQDCYPTFSRFMNEEGKVA